MSTAETATQPHRVVDGEHVGWWLVGPGPSSASGYVNRDSYIGGLDPVPYEELPPPRRPVLSVSDEDERALCAAFEKAGRKAAYTLAVAVYEVRGRLFRQYPTDTMEQRRDAIDRSKAQLLAGRPGSWEADRLWELSLWADADKARRIDPESLQEMTGVLWSWVTDPDRYTEVAETLADIVSGYADEHGGWPSFADQWLQPDAGLPDREGLYLVYGLFYSRSEHFDPGALG